ncbi:hypothetical protein BMS3Bbin02_01835 [bacterium BMS3Bbin02]|nr:hypothetical protein BMS3Bbin02_01835 [bacterium BMS3Bbin02]
MTVAKTIGAALRDEFEPDRVGVIVAGLEVPHAHVHLIPFDTESELSFSRANADVDPSELDIVADRIRARLTLTGFDQATQTV